MNRDVITDWHTQTTSLTDVQRRCHSELNVEENNSSVKCISKCVNDRDYKDSKKNHPRKPG